jgi:hypothetical protein
VADEEQEEERLLLAGTQRRPPVRDLGAAIHDGVSEVETNFMTMAA